jgi:bisphosphoglycerate-independent phosphoglycerate mutase (AlkP superfamily)
VTFISYGETDDFAHDGRYDEYIFAAQRTDRFIRELWEFVQSTEGYRDNTVLFITVDHGRGEEPIETWQYHASKESLTGYMQSLAQYEEGIVGSEHTWMAAIGPGVPATGLIAASDENCVPANRIAATLLQLLDVDYRSLNPAMGAPLQEFLP